MKYVAAAKGNEHHIITFDGRDSELGAFAELRGVAVSPRNEVFVIEKELCQVQIFNLKGAYVHHFPTVVSRSEDVSLDGSMPAPGHPLFMCTRDGEWRKYGESSERTYNLFLPHRIAADRQGFLWVVGMVNVRYSHAELNNISTVDWMCPTDRVVQYNRNGVGLATFGIRHGTCIDGMAVDPRNDHIALMGWKDSYMKVYIFRPDGSVVRTLVRKERLVPFSSTLAVNRDGNIFVPTRTGTVQVYNETGQFLFSFGSYESGDGELKAPRDICTDRYGNVIVADRKNKRVSVFTSRGQFVHHVAIGLTVEHIAVGPEGQLVVTYPVDNGGIGMHGRPVRYNVSILCP
ncbi:uncharacterized protein LOC118432264 [Branchiostoma floridae]|uniref:Uncharacterized protein LOC118432264 n=1 Tax=Branchiostoma floridae TaxID=7739 RepID=A0A9J7NB44_BRAFL|nr:uncharacterized protein LOC118432264 [Branchiostoma floridae]